MTADFSLAGRVALVTGATSGIGRRQAFRPISVIVISFQSWQSAMVPFGSIDILINAAGVNLRQSAEEITLERLPSKHAIIAGTVTCVHSIRHQMVSNATEHRLYNHQLFS